MVEPFGKRGVHDQFGCGLFLDFKVRCGAADVLRALRGGLYIGACRYWGPGADKRLPLQLQPAKK